VASRSENKRFAVLDTGPTDRFGRICGAEIYHDVALFQQLKRVVLLNFRRDGQARIFFRRRPDCSPHSAPRADQSYS
jgi:hypothetical protein